jgi:hypothetical protein
MVNLSIIVLNYNTCKQTLNCLQSIFRSKIGFSFRVVVVDNASNDGSAEEIKKRFKNVKLIVNKKNYGFAKGNNIGIRSVFEDSKYILLLNSDTIIQGNALETLVDYADDKKADISSCKLIYPSGKFQPNGGKLPFFLPTFFWLSGLDDILRRVVRLPSYQEILFEAFRDGKIDWVSGTVMLIRSEVFRKIGFLDERIFMYGEDVDFCFRARKNGLSVGWTDSCRIVHIGGASSLRGVKYNQWLGEFKGLLYIYKKHFGRLSALLLRLALWFFVFLRIIAFFAVGKPNYAKTYARIIFKI